MQVKKLTVVVQLKKSWEEFNIGSKCDALRDLVPFVQFKKREKHPCSVKAKSLQLYEK